MSRRITCLGLLLLGVSTLTYVTLISYFATTSTLREPGIDDDDDADFAKPVCELECGVYTGENSDCLFYQCELIGDPPVPRCLLSSNETAACVDSLSTDAAALQTTFSDPTPGSCDEAELALFVQTFFSQTAATLQIPLSSLALLNASCAPAVPPPPPV